MIDPTRCEQTGKLAGEDNIGNCECPCLPCQLQVALKSEAALKAENTLLRAAIDEVARITVDKDRVAEAIYRASPWNDPGVTGHPQREWRIEGVPWDTDSDVQLCEHERDDYRSMARGVIDYLRTACEAIVRDGKANAA